MDDSPPPLAAAILITWRRNRAYALRLVGDLGEADMVGQPLGAAGPTLNHPAWILSHLSVYAPIAAALARGAAFDDPAEHPHGQKSSPLGDSAAYLPRASLIDAYARLHDDAQSAVEGTTPAALRAANPLERWRAVHPTVGDMLMTLMVKHEAHHLGQLSAWRRAMGRPGVPM